MSFQSPAQHRWFQGQWVYRTFNRWGQEDPIFGPDHVDVVLHQREETNQTEPMNEELMPMQDCEQGLCRKTTMLEELQNKRKHRAAQLKELDGAISALSANPALADTLEAVRRALRQ